MNVDGKSDNEKQEKLELVNRMLEMSEDLMRDSRADRLLLFLKLRYKENLDISD